MKLTVLPNNPRKSPHMQSAKSSDQIAFYTPQGSLNLLIFQQTDQLPLRCDCADASLYHTNCKHALSAVAKCWLHITSLRECFRAGRRNRIAVGQCQINRRVFCQDDLPAQPRMRLIDNFTTPKTASLSITSIKDLRLEQTGSLLGSSTALGSFWQFQHYVYGQVASGRSSCVARRCEALHLNSARL